MGGGKVLQVMKEIEFFGDVVTGDKFYYQIKIADLVIQKIQPTPAQKLFMKMEVKSSNLPLQIGEGLLRNMTKQKAP